MSKTTTIIITLVVVSLLVGGVIIWKNSNSQSDKKITQSNGLTVVKLSASRMGVYDPKIIKVKVGTKLRIEGDPESLAGSMDTMIVDGYELSKKVEPGDNVLEFIADKAGTYKVHCANGMGNGTLIVE